MEKNEHSLSDTMNSNLFLIPCDPRGCCSAASYVFMCVIKAACVGCISPAPPSAACLPGVESEPGSLSVFSLCSLHSNVGVPLQLCEVVGGAHEHAASSLQPALLVREAEGLHELVDVDAAVLVAVDGDGQVEDGLVRDLHL